MSKKWNYCGWTIQKTATGYVLTKGALRRGPFQTSAVAERYAFRHAEDAGNR